MFYIRCYVALIIMKIPKSCVTKVKDYYNLKFYNLKTKKYEHIDSSYSYDKLIELYRNYENEFYLENNEFIPKGILVIKKPSGNYRFSLKLNLGVNGHKQIIFKNIQEAVEARKKVLCGLLDL